MYWKSSLEKDVKVQELFQISNIQKGKFSFKNITEEIMIYSRFMKREITLIFFTDFSKVCEQSTDFHFPDLDQQFAIIEQELALANEHRQQNKHSDDADKASIKSSSSTSSEVRLT